MTIPNGPVTLADIQAEFGGPTNPIVLSNYYRGGAYVPIGTPTSPIDGVPISTSGPLRLGMFRGVSNAVAVNLTISADTANYNIFTAAGSPALPATVTLTIDAAASVYSTNASLPALRTGTGWVAGSTISIVCNGKILGGGGPGGINDRGANHPGYDGLPGGTAFKAEYACLFSPLSATAEVNGGGGGGGEGGPTVSASNFGSGGFGGKGREYPNIRGSQGQNGGYNGADNSGSGGLGQLGNATVVGGPGGNGSQVVPGVFSGGGGGGGGGWGSPGGRGGNSGDGILGGAGGLAGLAVENRALVNLGSGISAGSGVIRGLQT